MKRLLVLAVLAELAWIGVFLDAGDLGLSVSRPSLWLPFAIVPYGVALVALARLRPEGRRAVLLVVGVAVVLQVLALSRPPQTSNDDLRYIWDGKVQLAGVSPYRYVPDDPALARLHEPLLFTSQDCSLPTGCARLNRPTVHTIYPPVAQAAFVVVRVLSWGGRGGQRPFQVAAALGSLLLTLLLLRRARARGTPAWHAAAWGWSPVVVSELGNNAHIDWVATLLCYAALVLYAAARPRWAGVMVGAAIATKLYPALILPALLRRRAAAVLTAAVGVIVVGYVPHVLAVGSAVIGYLPHYLDEEGYDSGQRLLLLGPIVPHPFDTAVGALLMLVAAYVAWRRTDPARPELSAVWLVGVAFLVATPNYGWYAVLLVALVAMTARWEWLPVASAPTFTYLFGPFAGGWAWAFYAGAALLGAALWLARRRDGRPEAGAASGAAGGEAVVEGRPVEHPRSATVTHER